MKTFSTVFACGLAAALVSVSAFTGPNTAEAGTGGLVVLTAQADGGVTARPFDNTINGIAPEKARIAAEATLGKRFTNVGEFCNAWDAKIGPLLDERVKVPDDFTPKDHACKSKGALTPSFVATASVKGVTRVDVYSENWIEERIAIETPSGVFVPAESTIDTTPFNDPGCYGSNKITVKSVTASGSNVAIRYEDGWTRSRLIEAEAGGILGTTTADDIKTILMECKLAAAAGGSSNYACSQKTLTRVCHVDKAVAPCDSF